MKGIPTDKILHFLAGFFFACVFGLFLHPVVGFIFSVAIGVLKELYDRRKGGLFDLQDLFATIIGGGLFAILFIIADDYNLL